MYSNLEKLVLAVVAVAMVTLILFTNSTKDVELSSTSPLETESVISQEVAVVSDEVVEDVTHEYNNAPKIKTLAGGVTEVEPTAENNQIDGVTAPEDFSLFSSSYEPENHNFEEATFPEAFAAARATLGPGRAFKWQGMMYSTNLWYEERMENTMELKTIDWALIESYEGDSFKVAFIKARKQLGPGQVFEWEDRLYTTNYFYEDTVVIANEVTIDEDNQSIIDTERFVDRSHVKVYASEKDTEVSFDLIRGTKEGTSNEIASTGVQQQRIIVNEE